MAIFSDSTVLTLFIPLYMKICHSGDNFASHAIKRTSWTTIKLTTTRIKCTKIHKSSSKYSTLIKIKMAQIKQQKHTKTNLNISQQSSVRTTRVCAHITMTNHSDNVFCLFLPYHCLNAVYWMWAVKKYVA